MLASCSMRRALPEDAEEISQLEMEFFPEDWLNPWSVRQEMRHDHVWVTGDGEVTGYLIARVEGDLVDILRVGVRKDQRGNGLGFRLMTKAMSMAPRAVLMVRRDNEAAIGLYLGLGFRIVGQFGKSWTMATSACT